MNDWTWDNDYSRAYAETDDPRVIAVIERDRNVTFSEALDGDAIPPVYMVDRGRVFHNGGYEGSATEELAQRIVDARDGFRYAAGYRYDGLSVNHIIKSEDLLRRWAWIFHGTTFNRGDYGYQGGYDVLILSTPEFRQHVDPNNEYPVTREEAQSMVDAMGSEVANIADGEVYGIGYATRQNRVDTETDVPDPEMLEHEGWDVEIQCWGYVGDKYAKESALAFEAGEPSLPPMLDLIPA